MGWTKWHRISEMQVNPAENCKFGVYQIRATSDDRNPIAVPRACAVDPEGILYIGRGNLPHRVGRLLRIYEQNPKPHHNFIRVFLAYGLDRICEAKLLEIRYMECNEFALEEGRMLQEYKKRTGDMPPGNLKLEPFTDPVAVAFAATVDLEGT